MNHTIYRKNLRFRDQVKSLEEKLTVNGKLMNDERLRVVQMESSVLLQELKEGKISSESVLEAFQSKALMVTKRLNCITEFIREAEEWAKACDRIPVEERGPLHGLPISIKENINVRGMDTTMGLAKYLDNPVSSHAVVVEVLIRKGAVPFCKTNIPQSLMSFCCSNPVFGETKNPHDISRTPGGSSGGEAALIGAGGSIFGIGSDLAGSARIPANFSGCLGMRPTTNRFSSSGLKKVLQGQPEAMSTVGFLGRDLNLMITCMKALLEDDIMHSLDPACVPIPWREPHFNTPRKLVFGYFDNLDIFPTAPGVRRAIHVAKKALESKGHKVIPFEITKEYELLIETIHSYTSDGGCSLADNMKNENIDISIKNGIQLILIPNYLKPLKKAFIKMKSPLVSHMIQTRCNTTSELWKHLIRRDRMEAELIRRMKESSIDLLLSPANAVPAPPPVQQSVLLPSCIYSSMFNFFNFPSFSVSVTKENENDQKLLEDYPEDEALYRVAKEATRGAAGLPLGVLISGLPWEEELVCRGVMELQEALKSPEHTQ